MTWAAERDALLIVFLAVSVLALVIGARAWRGPKGE